MGDLDKYQMPPKPTPEYDYAPAGIPVYDDMVTLLEAAMGRPVLTMGRERAPSAEYLYDLAMWVKLHDKQASPDVWRDGRREVVDGMMRRGQVFPPRMYVRN